MEILDWEVSTLKNLGAVRMRKFTRLSKKRFGAGAIDSLSIAIAIDNIFKRPQKVILLLFVRLKILLSKTWS